MLHGETSTVGLQASHADSDSPSLNEGTLFGLQVGREAAAASKTVQERSFDNHARENVCAQPAGILGTEYFKIVTEISTWYLAGSLKEL